MILVLHIIDKNKAAWILQDKVQVFDMKIGQDNILLELKKLDVDFKKINGLILAVKDASLTQAKVFTTIINTLGWYFSVPVVADFYYKGDFEIILEKLKNNLAKKKKFEQIKVEYKHKPDITLSKKEPKYKINK